MAVHDDLWQGLISSLVSDESNESVDILSPEDAAWVDSCLVKDPELSDNTWKAMKDALVEILNIEPTLRHDTLASKIEGSPHRTYDEVLVPMSEEAKTAKLLGGADVKSGLIDAEEAEDAQIQGYLRNNFLSNPFDMEEDKNSDDGLDLGFLNEIDLPEDIFRVWDLETPVPEEDKLVEELKIALTESSLRAQPSLDVDETLENLISGMADLSLRSSSG